MPIRFAVAALTLGGLAGLAAPARAQEAGPGPAASEIALSPTQLAATSRLAGPAATRTLGPADQPTLTRLPHGGNKEKGAVLVICGLAAITTGLLVDEDIITIAGAGVGVFGLYLYLKG